MTMTREYPRQPITAVAGVVVRDEEVLLVRRGKAPGVGLWSIPGGAVHLGEGLQEALRREIREETGLVVRPVTVIEVVERIVREGDDIRYHYVIVDYACLPEGGTLQAGDDAAEACWVPWKRIEEYGLSHETLSVITRGRSALLAKSIDA